MYFLLVFYGLPEGRLGRLLGTSKRGRGGGGARGGGGRGGHPRRSRGCIDACGEYDVKVQLSRWSVFTHNNQVTMLSDGRYGYRLRMGPSWSKSPQHDDLSSVVRVMILFFVVPAFHR